MLKRDARASVKRRWEDKKNSVIVCERFKIECKKTRERMQNETHKFWIIDSVRIREMLNSLNQWAEKANKYEHARWLPFANDYCE